MEYKKRNFTDLIIAGVNWVRKGVECDRCGSRLKNVISLSFVDMWNKKGNIYIT